MITKNIKNFNSFIRKNQKEYDKYINDTNFQEITCQCGMSGNYIKHGFYTRYLKYIHKYKVQIKILRVRCKCCGRTHAVLPPFIVPYSQIPLDEMLLLIGNYEDTQSVKKVIEINCDHDDYDVRRVIKTYIRSWKERLKALGMTHKAIQYEKVIKIYKMMFMQNKMTYYNC